VKLSLKDRTHLRNRHASSVLDDFEAGAVGFSSLDSATFIGTPGPFDASASLMNAFFVSAGQADDGGIAPTPLEPLGTNPGPISPTDVSWISGIGTSGGTGASGGTGSLGGVATGSGFHINLLYDAAAMAAPQTFRDGVQTAMNMLSAAISDNITVNIKIDYSGTGGGAAAGPDAGLYETYSSVRNALVSNASAGDTTFNSLPNTTSIQGQSNVAVWNAQLKLFGLVSPNDTTTDDGSATFATDIDPNRLVGVALHELTHALGRVPYGSQPDIFDFYRFTSTGHRLFSDGSTASAAYFSLDGGATKIADYGETSDPSDFLNNGVQGANDPFNEFYTSNTLQQLTAADLFQIDALGFHLAPPPDRAPIVTPVSSNLILSPGQASVAASSLFTASDPDGDAIAQYAFWDSGVGGAHLLVNGTTEPLQQAVPVSAAQLAQTTYQSGTGTDTLYVKAYDGSLWSDWKSFTVSGPIDRAPAVTVSNLTASKGQVFGASSLFSAYDPDGDAITQYAFWDSGVGGAHLLVNGTTEPLQQAVTVSAAQLSQTTYQSGAGTDTLYVKASDGSVWSDWKSFTVAGPIDHAPAVTVSNLSVSKGQVFGASSLFSASDPDGDAITQYAFWDTGVGGAHLLVNGTIEPLQQAVPVSAAQLAQTTYQSGAGTDTLYVKASDGSLWSDWTSFTVSGPIDRAPAVTVSNLSASKGQVFGASSLFSASDPDGDAITQYAFWDMGVGGAHLLVNGTTEPLQQAVTVSAAQLSQTTYQSGAGIDTLYVKASDGSLWSDWKSFNITAPTS
jgi:hypothetical protein